MYNSEFWDRACCSGGVWVRDASKVLFCGITALCSKHCWWLINDRIYSQKLVLFRSWTFLKSSHRLKKKERKEGNLMASFNQSVLIQYHSPKILRKDLGFEWELCWYLFLCWFLCCSMCKRAFFFLFSFFLFCWAKLRNCRTPESKVALFTYLPYPNILLPAAALVVLNSFTQLHENCFKSILFGLFSFHGHKHSRKS